MTTPPYNPTIEVQRASSNPNITGTLTEPEFVNITKRSKRPRSESSPTNELGDFKEEIREMLTKWNADQKATLKNFMSKITTELAELKLQNEKLRNIRSEIEASASLMNENYEEMKSQLVK